jgi:hypothetical protein
MNSAWWPSDLTNVTLYSSKSNNHSEKYNIHIHILFQKILIFFYATITIIYFDTLRNTKPIS